MEKDLAPNTRVVLHRHGVKIRQIEYELEKVTKEITKILIEIEMLNAKESRFDTE